MTRCSLAHRQHAGLRAARLLHRRLVPERVVPAVGAEGRGDVGLPAPQRLLVEVGDVLESWVEIRRGLTNGTPVVNPAEPRLADGLPAQVTQP